MLIRLLRQSQNRSLPWWSEEYGFFGKHYIEADDSFEGYLTGEKQSLRERTLKEVEGIVSLLDLRGNERILDIPCGYGRHSIELALRGFDITGSDLNSVHLQKAMDDAASRNIKIKFVRENMINANYHSEFDVLINMFWSFGIFEQQEENLKIFKNFFAALKLRGKFLLHTVNPLGVSGKGCGVRHLVSGKMLEFNSQYNPVTKRVNGHWLIRDDKKGCVVGRDYSVRSYTKEELIKMAKSAGFKKINVYANWEGKAYMRDYQDMIIVAQK